MPSDAYHSTDFSIPLQDRVKNYLASVISDPNHNGFDTALLSKVEFVGIVPEEKRSYFRFTVDPTICNKDGNLHGGAASSLFDNLSSMALYTVGRPGFWDNLGVSRSIYVVFHKGMPQGTEVHVVSEVVAAGGKMATLKSTMQSANGTVFATCIHEKFAIGVPKM